VAFFCWPASRIANITPDPYQTIHVVVADNVDDQENIVITAYEPDPTEWEPDFKRRKTS
jgi:hypothetical protein